jgi:pectin methylesterase-like acyl-CoA thioesterase
MYKKSVVRLLGLAVVLAILLAAGLGLAQGPNAGVGGSFTYQGRLTDGDSPADGEYDLKFQLYDSATKDNTVGDPFEVDGQQVEAGLFTTVLTFDDVLAWEGMWLEVSVRPGDSNGAYTALTPLQSITAAPWALYAKNIPLAGNGSAETAARSDHMHAGSAYDHVIVVAKSGGDFTSVQAALDSIDDNDQDNRYLVWVAPGTYEGRVTMKEYVDIEGAGETATIISALGSTFVTEGTVKGADNAELRFLTVLAYKGLDPATNTIGILNNSVDPRITHVTVIATGANSNYGIYNAGSGAVMDHVTVLAKGTGSTNSNIGVYSSLSTPTLKNMDILAQYATNNTGVRNSDSAADIRNCKMRTVLTTGNSYGIYNDAVAGTYTVTVHNSEVFGAANTIRNDAEYSTQVAATMLDGGPVLPNGGTVTCAGVWDEDYVFSASTCP